MLLRRGLSTNAEPLKGQVAWIVGGIGVVGTGIARALLDQGAAVIVNSRHPGRLTALSEELGHPDNLVTIPSSMLPESAEATVRMAMDVTGNRLDHVIAHSAVQWYTAGGGDETSTVASKSSLMHVAPPEYAALASQLGSLHYAAAHHLTPLLKREGTGMSPGTFTFLTCSADTPEGAGAAFAHINAHGVMGLAAAMRSEGSEGSLKINVGELHLGAGLRLNRPMAERESAPRAEPLSHEIGKLIAGMAARGKGGYMAANDLFEFELLMHEV